MYSNTKTENNFSAKILTYMMNSNNDTLRCNFIRNNLQLEQVVQEINRIRDDNLYHLLTSKRLHLILDLDNTLLHSTLTCKLTSSAKEYIDSTTSIVEDVYKICGGTCVVKLRPGVRKFIALVSSMFDLSIYTMGSRYYAQEVYELLVSKAGFPRNCSVITREDCVEERQKGLDVVLSHEKVVVIVDDKVDVWEESCKKNVLKIGRYDYFPIKKGFDDEEEVDTELGRVFRDLMLVHNMFYDDNEDDCGSRDVRDVLESVLMRSVSGCKDGGVVCGRKRLRDNTMGCVQTQVKRRKIVDNVVESVQV